MSAIGNAAERIPAEAVPQLLTAGTRRVRRRGWLVRRLLLCADVAGLGLAFVLAQLLVGGGSSTSADRVDQLVEVLLFAATLPGWVVVTKIYGLYDQDEERAGHSTVDDFVGVFHLVTVGTWLFALGSFVTGLAEPDLTKLTLFWALAVGLVSCGRTVARAIARRSASYVQNTLVVGAGEIGQLVARKILQHPEYGISVVGFVDADPREARADLGALRILGSPRDLPALVRQHGVERVIVAFTRESHAEMLDVIARVRGLNVQVDIVPRLFETVSPNVAVHTLEGMPLLGLPPAKLSRSSMLLKRTVDVVGAVAGLVLTAPLFALIAFLIKRDSDGPVLFRQRRLGMGMAEFTALKFRTMKVDTDDSAHRDYVRSIMASSAVPGNSGIYKLDRGDSITRVGRWLRKTSLDELPQLINVLRGEMSLVGPRPCIPYEVESFAPHHFERFNVPQGITGLWQVTARAHSTFAEALDLDVAYARGWSLGLDLALLCRTPFQALRGRSTA